jgi:hypothetical protein
MPAHVVCPTLSTMCSELLSGRPRAGSGVDDDRYVRLLAVDPVLRSIAGVQGRPDPFAWFVAGGAGATNFAAMVLNIGSQQISTRAALAVFDRIRDAAGGLTPPASTASGPTGCAAWVSPAPRPRRSSASPGCISTGPWIPTVSTTWTTPRWFTL